MARKGNEDINKELERIREELIKINKKVKKYLELRYEPYHSIETRSNLAPDTSNEIPLKEIRKKLYVINSCLREQIGTETAALGVPYISWAVKKDLSERLGIGFDLGTSYIVAAREIKDRNVFIKSERNVFLSTRADKVTQDLLTRLRVKYVSVGNKMYILGRSALDLANIFNREVQRPMSQGILNPSEIESIPMIKMLIQNVLWNPREPGEVCCFSIPSPPIDRDQDTIYHRSVFEGILRSLDFEPVIIDEGYAVVLAELGYQDFTGIGISCGGGLVNICAAFRSVPAISFSISRGGDWIDKSAASVLGIPSSRVTALKEQGMNLKRPVNREEEAIAIYYRHFIHYFLENIAQVFGRSSNAPQFKEPVDIVLAGGSVMTDNFLYMVKDELKSIDLGFPVSNIRKADEPFTTVSRGCLFNAINLVEHR